MYSTQLNTFTSPVSFTGAAVAPAAAGASAGLAASFEPPQAVSANAAKTVKPKYCNDFNFMRVSNVKVAKYDAFTQNSSQYFIECACCILHQFCTKFTICTLF